MTYRVASGVSIKRGNRTYNDGAILTDGDLPMADLHALELNGAVIALDKPRKAEKKDAVE